MVRFPLLNNLQRLTALVAGALVLACVSKNQPAEVGNADTVGGRFPAGSFGHAVGFLKKHQRALVLMAPDNDSAQLVVVPGYQGRVMTSTASGPTGTSYGWMNFSLIESGQFQAHMNAYGGEERFWLAPEGGQFAVFFKPGEPFDFAHWQTPALIDTVAFEVKEALKSRVTFAKKGSLTNHSGTRFDVEITRTVRALGRDEARRLLSVKPGSGVKMVAYESTNVLKNTGADWQKSRGSLAVWILGMFNASDRTIIVVPVKPDSRGTVALTDDYFGKIPADRLKTKNGAVFFKADGKARGKIGVAPGSTKAAAGSFDGKVLTLIQFDVDPAGDYLSSTWEHHANPYRGDAFNSYNDGLNAEGKQMGKLYELESTSPARALRRGEGLVHHHRTFHFEGDRVQLDALAMAVLGVSLTEMEAGLE